MAVISMDRIFFFHTSKQDSNLKIADLDFLTKKFKPKLISHDIIVKVTSF
jgi:hypothetical protein